MIVALGVTANTNEALLACQPLTCYMAWYQTVAQGLVERMWSVGPALWSVRAKRLVAVEALDQGLINTKRLGAGVS